MLAGVDIILVGIWFYINDTDKTPNHFLTQNSRISGPNPANLLTHGVNIKVYIMLHDSNNAVYYKSFLL